MREEACIQVIMGKEKIDLEELRKAFNLLIDHLSGEGVREVKLQQDYYWETSSEKLYDVATNPSDFSIGSLFDDWQSIQELAVGKSEPVVPLILKIAPLVRYIGDAAIEGPLSPSKNDENT